MTDVKMKNRTILYRRAVWFDDSITSLQEYMIAAHEHLNTTQKKTFPYADGEIQGLHTKSDESGFFLQVAFYTPQQPTSIVPFPSSAEQYALASPEPPPDNYNYMSGDIFFLVKNNHIVLCPSGLRENVAVSYIKEILKRLHSDDIVDKLTVEPVANLDKLEIIKAEGVKRVTLNASLYEASMNYASRNTAKSKISSGIANEIKSLFTKDPEYSSIDEKENLSVKLEISFDSRKKHGELGQKRIDKIANMLISEDEDQGFAILTSTGKRMTAKEIRIRERCNLPSYGNSVERSSAYRALKDYLNKLQTTGLLEQ